MIGGMFARYSTSAAGEDSARVAKFGEIRLEETGDFVEGTNKMLITPGVPIKKAAKVSFSESEVATYVFVEVKLSQGWTAVNGEFSFKNKLTWKIDDGWMQLGESTNVFYRQLAPNEALDAGIIKNNVIEVKKELTKNEIDTLTITVSFQASVVQSHGFADAAAAWASLQAKGVTS